MESDSHLSPGLGALTNTSHPHSLAGSSVGHGLPLASSAGSSAPAALKEPPEPFQLSRQEQSASVLRVMTHN